ncbi:unnamed protein product, partial [Musa acuminata var. zebrina]
QFPNYTPLHSIQAQPLSLLSSSSMASSAAFKMVFALQAFFSLILRSALAGVICEELPQEVCAFAVSSSSNRCLLESSQDSGGNTVYQCRASEIVVERLRDWIETEQCVSVCGVDRNAVGISSDALLEPHFTQQLCSAACHQNCPNIIDLHLDLAAAEGIFLPDLCEAQRVNPHRAMVEILSSGAAPGPVAGGAPLQVASPPLPV